MTLGDRIARIGALGLSQAELARARRHLAAEREPSDPQGRARLAPYPRDCARAGNQRGIPTGETDDPALDGERAPSVAVVAGAMGLVPVREVDLAIGLGAAYLDQPISDVQRMFPREWLDLYTRAPAESLIIARGSGDSMIPTILDNDLLLIDTTQAVPRLADQVWAVSYCGLGCVKRLRPSKDGGWLLMADNPAISPITAYDDELHVLGRVVAYFRKM
jgi:phage repressor protein C with HTH and peptisase S24 domain